MITALSFGAGQDSTAILYKIALDRKFREKYVKGRLLVIMSDTGDEHKDTYEHIDFIKSFCKSYSMEFYFIQAKDGFHSTIWSSLIAWMDKYRSIMSIGYVKSCTDNLKIKPFYNFLDNFIGKEYYGQNIKPSISRKRLIKQYAKENGKIHVLLGIARDEEKRISNNFPHSWMETSLVRTYPLINEGMNRTECQIYINSVSLPLPPPSFCKHCPYQSDLDLIWHFRFEPESFQNWIEREKAKIKKWRAKGLPDSRNLGAFGTQLLPERLNKALKKYGHLTDAELNYYRMTHGHCVKSKY